MKNILYKKFLSILLVFTILVNANIPAFSQKIDIQSEISVLRAEIAENLHIISEKDIKKEYKRETNFRTLFDTLNRQGFANNYGEVCDGDICAPYHTFMRGAISALLEFADNNGNILIEYAKEIRDAVFLGALSGEDVPLLRKLLIAGSKEKLKACNAKPNYKAQEDCSKAMTGLLILSVAWESQEDSNETANLIYRIINKYYDAAYGSIVLMEGISALAFIDTDYSYELIEKFLTQDITPTHIGNRTRDALGLFSLQGEYDIWSKYIAEEFKKSVSYFNRRNIIWQYIDKEATEKAGVDVSIYSNMNILAKSIFADESFHKASYRVAYRNLLTDIGEFLSNQEGRGRNLAKKIISKYLASSPKDRSVMHTPLILGLVQNLDIEEAFPAAKIINENFYYDLNEGTGKYVAEKSALKGSNLNPAYQNVKSEKEFLRTIQTRQSLFWGDMFLIFISTIALAAEIPNIVAQVKRLSDLLRFRRTAQVGITSVKNNINTANIAMVKNAATALPSPQLVNAAVKAHVPVINSSAASNALLKIRSVLNNSKTANVFNPEKFQLTLTSNNNPAVSKTIKAASRGSLYESVFKLQNYDEQFSGFLTEIPVYGVNRQVIVSVGHGVESFPEDPISVFDSSGKLLTTAHTVFYNLITDKITGRIKQDFALLLPRERLTQTPLDLVFYPELEKYSKVFSVGYPNGNFIIRNLTRNEHWGKQFYTKNVNLFEGRAIPGVSGGVVVAETEQGKFSAIGTTIATIQRGTLNFTAVHNFSWLEKFIKGQLDVSKLWAPNFRESFIKPKIPGTLPEGPFDNGITIKPTSASSINSINVQTNLNKTAKYLDDLTKSVFKLENIIGEFSGFLAEIPVFGVNRQVIVTAGHAVSNAPGASIDVYDRFNNFQTKANVLLFNYFEDGNLKFYTDYALLLPQNNLSVQPLKLGFNRQIADFDEAIQVSYPMGDFNLQIKKPTIEPYFYFPFRGVEYLKGENIPGSSGGLVAVETAPNEFEVLGNAVAHLKDETHNYTLVNKIDWLQNFMNGTPFRANFRNPIFPPVKTIMSNHKYIKGYGKPINISGLPDVINFSSSEFGSFPEISVFNTSMPKSSVDADMGALSSNNTPFAFDKPYLPLSNFNDYENAALFPMGNIAKKANPIWGIYDFRGNINKFLMYGTETDIRFMHLFSKIIKENNLNGKYELINIEYPEFISVIEDGLPDNVLQDITAIKENVKYPSNAILIPYTTTPIKINGAIWVEDDAAMNVNFIEKSDFVNKPITQEEWDEVLDLFQEINNDFIFDDLEKSIHFKRNTQGKLIIVFSNFKYSPLLNSNYTDVIEIGKKFESLGLKAGREGIIKKPRINPENTPSVLRNVVRADLVITDKGVGIVTHAVWRLFDNNNKIVGYLKYGTEEEIINTKKLHNIITKNNLLDNSSNVEITYSEILAENADVLPKDILKGVYEEYDRIKMFVRDPDIRAKKMFVISPVDEGGVCWGNIGMDREHILFAHVKLNNKPITSEEWETIFSFFEKLEINDFSYDDIYNNLFFKRDREGKLKITMVDFENENSSNMIHDLRQLGNTLTKYGLKEKNYFRDIIQRDFEEENNFPF